MAYKSLNHGFNEPTLFTHFDGEHCIYVTQSDFNKSIGQGVCYLCNNRVNIFVPFEQRNRFEELFNCLLEDGTIVLRDE